MITAKTTQNWGVDWFLRPVWNKDRMGDCTHVEGERLAEPGKESNEALV